MLIRVYGAIPGVDPLLLDQARGTFEATDAAALDLAHLGELLGIFL